MTEEALLEASQRGLDLPAALESGFLGLRTVRGSASGWCLVYRQVRAGGRCRGLAVYVDGVRVSDAGYFLASQPVDEILRVELLTALDATTRYGSTAGWGALVIVTRREH